MRKIIHGISAMTFLEVINYNFEDLIFLGLPSDLLATTANSQDLIDGCNASLGNYFYIGMSGFDFKRLFELKYSELIPTAIMSAAANFNNPDTESLIGKTVLPVGEYITHMNASGDYLIEDMVIEGIGGLQEIYNPNPQDPIGIIIHSTTKSIGNVVIRNCIVKNVNSVGIEVDGAKSILIENCHVENCNFVAYTLIGENIIVKNCTSKTTRMFLEVVTKMPESRLRVRDIQAFGLLQYMVKWYGAGTGYFIGTSGAGTPSYDFATGMSEGYGYYIMTDMYNTGNIEEIAIIDYKLDHMRIGAKFEQGVNNYPIEIFYKSNWVLTDMNYIDPYMLGVGVVINDTVI